MAEYRPSGWLGGNPEIRMGGTVTDHPHAMVRRKRNPLWLVVGLLLLVGGVVGITLAIVGLAMMAGGPTLAEVTGTGDPPGSLVILICTNVPVVVMIKFQYNIILQVHIHYCEHTVTKAAGLLRRAVHMEVFHLVLAGELWMQVRLGIGEQQHQR